RHVSLGLNCSENSQPMSLTEVQASLNARASGAGSLALLYAIDNGGCKRYTMQLVNKSEASHLSGTGLARVGLGSQQHANRLQLAVLSCASQWSAAHQAGSVHLHTGEHQDS